MGGSVWGYKQSAVVVLATFLLWAVSSCLLHSSPPGYKKPRCQRRAKAVRVAAIAIVVAVAIVIGWQQ